ncbi:MAG TPA: hypothetical protein VHG30_03030, partial [Microvirga sp.]|nr:hypothetical protein [Microvirga sp.]
MTVAVGAGGLPAIASAAPALAESKAESQKALPKSRPDTAPNSAEPTKPPKPLPALLGENVPRGFAEGRSVEDKSKRTSTSQTWNNADGSLTTRVSAEERFFHNGKAFEAIDNTLAAESPDGPFRNKANSFIARFGRSSARVDLETAEGRISMVPVGGRDSQGIVDREGETITYADVWPGVDVRYRSVNSGIKEEIVLRELPTTSDFAFRVDGTTLTLREDGGLATAGPFAGKWEVTPPVVFDKQGAIVADAGVQYRVDGQHVVLTVSDTWRKGLTKADLPVVLDPTWNHAGSEHVYAYKRNPNDDGYSVCASPCQP